MRYIKGQQKYGYVIINSDGDILDGLDENGQPHFTPQYLLEEMHQTIMSFKDKHRLPAQITSKLNTSHGLIEVMLDENGEAIPEAILNGRVIGKAQQIIAQAISHQIKSGSADTDYMHRARWHKD